MDLDLAQVRAFVAAAEELHFGRAAGQLFLTQQALSKRIARLENELGVRLFVRGKQAVELTGAGHRFLAPARQALADADRAIEAARHSDRPLRIDMWGHLYEPMRSVGPVIAGPPELSSEVGQTRDLPAAVTALLRGEIDAGFGRVHPVGEPGEERLTSRLARLEPVDAVLSNEHPLAAMPELHPADLQQSTLWCPTALSKLDFYQHFAEHFGIHAEDGGPNLGLDHLIGCICADQSRFSLLPADIPLPDGTEIRSIPLVSPTPLYAWSLLWHSQDQHPLLGAMLQRFAEIGRRLRWLSYDPGRDWLPVHDHTEFRRLGRLTASHRH